MTSMALPFSPMGPRSDLDLAEAAWLVAWRAFWLDLPLAWASEVDRFLFRWIAPTDTETDTAVATEETGQGTAVLPTEATSPDEPVAATKSIALSLDCGDHAREVLG